MAPSAEFQALARAAKEHDAAVRARAKALVEHLAKEQHGFEALREIRAPRSSELSELLFPAPAPLAERLVKLFEPLPRADLREYCAWLTNAVFVPTIAIPVPPTWERAPSLEGFAHRMQEAIEELRAAALGGLAEPEKALLRLKLEERIGALHGPLERLLASLLPNPKQYRKPDRVELVEIAAAMIMKAAPGASRAAVEDVAARVGEFFGVEPSRRGADPERASERRRERLKKRRQRSRTPTTRKSKRDRAPRGGRGEQR